jgi:hypothetical protein
MHNESIPSSVKALIKNLFEEMVKFSTNCEPVILLYS